MEREGFTELLARHALFTIGDGPHRTRGGERERRLIDRRVGGRRRAVRRVADRPAVFGTADCHRHPVRQLALRREDETRTRHLEPCAQQLCVRLGVHRRVREIVRPRPRGRPRRFARPRLIDERRRRREVGQVAALQAEAETKTIHTGMHPCMIAPRRTAGVCRVTPTAPTTDPRLLFKRRFDMPGFPSARINRPFEDPIDIETKVIDVSMHIVKAERIGRIVPDLVRPLLRATGEIRPLIPIGQTLVFTRCPSAVVRIARRGGQFNRIGHVGKVAPVVQRRRRSRAARILPLGLGRQVKAIHPDLSPQHVHKAPVIHIHRLRPLNPLVLPANVLIRHVLHGPRRIARLIRK